MKMRKEEAWKTVLAEHSSDVKDSDEERMKEKYERGNPKRISPTHTSLKINLLQF